MTSHVKMYYRGIVVFSFSGLAMVGCVAKIPYKYNDKPIVDGRIVDTEGQPIEKVVVHVADVRAVGGTFHNSAMWTDLIRQDRFVTGVDGRYSGRLSFQGSVLGIQHDEAGNVEPEDVFYYACKDGYQPVLLFFPHRETVVMRRVDQPPDRGPSYIFDEVFRTAGCQ